MTNLRQPKRIPFLGVLLLCGVAFGIMLGGFNCLVTQAQNRAQEQCTELCAALGHKKIKMTDLGCVCENPKTEEREVHTGPLEVVR